MEALAWTAVGLLGAALLGSFGGFFYLGTRIDALGARLDSRMGGLSDRLDAQSARIDAQGAELGARIDGLSDRLVAQRARIDAQGAELGARIDALTARMDEHLGRHAG